MRHRLAAAPLLLLVACVDTGPPSLDVNVTRGTLGLQFVNRMPGPITDCLVIARERGRKDEWTAAVAKVDRMETARLVWSDFHSAAGDPMPLTVSADVRTVSFRCTGPNGTPVDTGVLFDR